MFYSILESIDIDMCQWLRLNRGVTVLNLTFINYMLFFTYSVTELVTIKYILTVSMLLLIGLMSSYVNALDKDYYVKRAEEEAASDDTAASEGSEEASATTEESKSATTTVEESGEFVQAAAADTAEESDVETVHDTVVSGAVTVAPTVTESANTESSTTS